MSKSILSVVVLAIVASVANAQFMEPLVKTSLHRDPSATRFDQAVSLQQIDMKNYASHKDSLDTSVAGGSVGYLAKVPASNVKAEIEKIEDVAVKKLEEVKLAPEIEPQKLVEEVEHLMLAEGEPLDVEILAKDVEKIDPTLKALPHDEVVKALEVVVEVAEDSKKEMAKAIEVAELISEPTPVLPPIVEAEIMKIEAKAIDVLSEVKTLDPAIKPMVLVPEIEDLVIKGEKDVETLAKDVEALEPALAKLPHAEVVEAVQLVVNVIDEGKKDLEEAKELAEGCDGQPRFNILMCESHMCTQCVLEYCTEKCQKIQKDFPTCRCADWPASRKSFSTGKFAGKGRFGDAGDYAKPGSYRFL